MYCSILQQLEALRIVEKDPNGGRIITSDGQRDLDRIAGRVAPAPSFIPGAVVAE